MLLNTCGYVLLYLFVHNNQETRFEMMTEHKYNGMSFERISVPLEDISTGKIVKVGEHEWKINGRLYDVTSVLNIDKQVIFICYHDKNDELAQETLSRSLLSQSAARDHETGSSKQDLGKDIKFFETGTHTLLTSPDLSVPEPNYISPPVHPGNALVESPPPQQAFIM